MNAPVETKPVHKFERAGLGRAPFRVSGFKVCKYQACYGAPVQPGAACSFCGTGIMYVFEITSADKQKFHVGSDCVAKTGDAGLIKQVRRARTEHRLSEREALRRADEDQRRVLIKAAVEERLATDLELAEAFAECRHEFVRDVHSKFLNRGRISPLQRDLVLKFASEEKHGIMGPVEPPLVEVPKTEERVVIQGTILALKRVEGPHFRTQLKMLLSVRTPDGYWKAWGTVPAALPRPEEGLRGTVVKVKAKVERSHDLGFAFLNRPTVAK